jgi:hypothetical protein
VANKSGSSLARILPYLAVGGLLYLMAQNASKVKAAGGVLPSTGAPAGAVGNNCGGNDFGTTPGCWSC